MRKSLLSGLCSGVFILVPDSQNTLSRSHGSNNSVYGTISGEWIVKIEVLLTHKASMLYYTPLHRWLFLN